MEGSGLEPLARVRDLVERGALTEAQRMLRRALTDDPASTPALTLAGHIEVRRSAAGAAIRQFRRAARSSRNDDPRPLLNLARAQQMNGNAEDAVATARHAAELFPDDVRPRGLIALISLSTGTLDRAAAALQAGDASELDPGTAYKLGHALAQEAQHSKLAAELLGRAASTPGRFQQDALRDLAVSVLTPDDPQSFHVARRYLVLAPDAVDGMDAVARVYEKRRYPVKQAAWLWQSCCVRNDDVPRLKKAAEVTYQVKWPSHGIAAHRALLRHDPRRLETIYRICELFTRHHELSSDKDAARAQALAWGQPASEMYSRDPRIQDALACMYKSAGAFDEARELWRHAIKRFPQFQVLHYNYALFLDEQDQVTDCIRVLRQALTLTPGYVKAGNLLSLASTRVHDLRAGLRYVRWAIYADPLRSVSWTNYGSHLRSVGTYGKALAAFEHSEKMAEAEAEREQAKVDRAEASGNKDRAAAARAEVARCKEEAAAARFNLGMSYLSMGELKTGFHLLESRWATKGFPSPRRSFRQRIWEGPQIHPKTQLLLYMEQGMGDEVMISWYLPLLRRETRRLVVDCDERLVSLFARTYEGIEFVARSREGHELTRDPALRHKVPSMHVPQHFVPELKYLMRDNGHWAGRVGTRFPARLVLDPERLANWDRWLDERYPGRPRIALSWRSKMRNRMRDQQYLSIAELADALPEGIVAINLQYSSTDEEKAELQELAQRRGFEFVTPEGVDLTNDLEDVFALLQVSDAAVTPMISLAWMAGAVGCPGYIFRTSRERQIWQQFGVPFVPWAPSLRLFFREPAESWDATVLDLRQSLVRFLSTESGRRG